MPAQAERFDQWAIVELMGHVRMAGRVTEEERFGVVVGRVDVPVAGQRCDPCEGRGSIGIRQGDAIVGLKVCQACEGTGEAGRGFTTVYFSGASLYRLTPTTEEIARHVARGSQPEPVHRWELPRPEKAPAILDGREEEPEEDDRDEEDDIVDDDVPFATRRHRGLP